MLFVTGLHYGQEMTFMNWGPPLLTLGFLTLPAHLNTVGAAVCLLFISICFLKFYIDPILPLNTVCSTYEGGGCYMLP